VIVDGSGPLPIDAKVFHRASPAPTWVAVAPGAPAERVGALRRLGLDVIEAGGSHGRVSLTHLLKYLGDRDVTSVMLEGGEGIFTSALEEGVVDKCVLFVAPLLVGGSNTPAVFGGEGIERLDNAIRLERVRLERLDGDLLVEGYLSARQRHH
jgi:diaminohydroxyphosphoribosylaminopyrimidine deaminase/5-amino-6-(5-phosphoribosylamino)uracil reductase